MIKKRRLAKGLGLFLGLLIFSFCAQASDPPAFQDVTVKRGDTLWGIAQTYLKDPAKWDEILKYNELPSSDPTAALPGMTLRVPVRLIKENLRAAHLIEKIRTVYVRRRDTAEWKSTQVKMELFQGDSIRTLDSSRAKVQFLNGGLLALDANSLAIIQPPKADYDLDLKKGGVFVGRSRIITASARIEPRTSDTQYMAKVSEDLSTLVEVYHGQAAVSAQGHTINVNAGMSSKVSMGFAPELPRKITDLPDVEQHAAFLAGLAPREGVDIGKGAKVAQGALAEQINDAADAQDLQGDVASLSVGVPISGFHVQASLSSSFDSMVFNKTFDSDEKFDPNSTGLPAGVYWWRIAIIDLLGTEEKFSNPRLYSVGLAKKSKNLDLRTAVVIVSPQDNQEVSTPELRVSGLIKSNAVTVTVDGKPVRVDEDGNFFVDVKLNQGDNAIAVTVSDSSGNSTTITRRVVYSGG